MSIYGVSGYNSYSYQNTLNMLKLSSLSQTNKSSSSAVNPIEKVSKTTSKTSAYSDLNKFLKDYQSELTSLESAASKLQGSSKSNIFTDLEAASTDSSVATAKGVYGLKAGTDISLDVQATAQAQKNASVSHYSQEQVKAGADIELDIGTSTGSFKISVSSQNENGTQKTYNQMYQEAAKQINANSKSGVKASVENVDGKVSLVIASKDTGESKGFTVSGNAGAAEGIAEASVKAQDAVYTVTQDGSSQTLTSESNTVSLDYGRMEVELKGEGETNIYTGIDTDKVASAVEDLVKSYNSVTNLLSENSGRGTGAASHLSSFNRGMADDKTLNALGISRNKDGDLELDKDKLVKALEEDYEGTKSLISGQFGIAEKAAQRADRALAEPVQRIANNDLTSAVSKTDDYSSIDFKAFSNFVKSSPYSLGNYYTVGLMLNTLA